MHTKRKPCAILLRGCRARGVEMRCDWEAMDVKRRGKEMG